MPDFALIFVFLFVFRFSCCYCWDKSGRKTQTGLSARLHWFCPLRLSCVASPRVIMFITGNKRQQLCNGALWRKWVYFLGEARSWHLSLIPLAPVPVLSWILSSCWAEHDLLEECSWIWMFCLADGHCPGCLTCSSHSAKDWIPELVRGFEVRYL